MKPMLKRFFPKLIFALLLLVFSGTIRQSQGLCAQTTPIGFTSVGLIGMPDTVFSGDSVLVGAFIKNYDTTGFIAFNDSIQIHGYIDTSSAYIPFVLPIVTQVFLASGDSTFFILPIGFRDPTLGGNFRIGNNVIVVWPFCFDPNFSTLDSIRANVFLIDTISGLGPDRTTDEGIRCFPVPASGPLFITSENNKLIIKEIIIRDANGKTVAVSENPSTGILTDNWASGIYMLEIIFENGRVGHYKIIR
ncbi:hypothetical protein BH09BAC5_BH09BAC5_01040 [soil metagenome]